MRASVPSAAIQELLDQGYREQEAIWLASCEALVKEVGPDDPIYNDQTFSLFYQMPSGRLEPLKIELPRLNRPTLKHRENRNLKTLALQSSSRTIYAWPDGYGRPSSVGACLPAEAASGERVSTRQRVPTLQSHD